MTYQELAYRAEANKAYQLASEYWHLAERHASSDLEALSARARYQLCKAKVTKWMARRGAVNFEVTCDGVLVGHYEATDAEDAKLQAAGDIDVPAYELEAVEI